MNIWVKRVLLVLVASVTALSTPAQAEELTESRTLEELFDAAPSGATRLVVDNIFGSVTISGEDRRTISMVAKETRQADTKAGIARAAEEVDLRIFRREGEIELFVDGPFRDENCRNRWSDREQGRPRYQVSYDFDIRVPFDTELEVRTITDGDIRISDVRRDFEVNNVNGSIRLEGMAGSGKVETVNGEIWASFAANPLADTRFITVNGEVEAFFQPGLSADLELKTQWGETWSEYPVVALPSHPPTQRTEDGRTVIEFESGSRVRAGEGGPKLYFETLNGDIYVRKSTS